MTNFRPHSESTYCSMPGEKVYNHTSRWQWICHHMALRGCLQYVLKRLFYVYLLSACLVFLVFYRQQYIQLGEYFKSASNSDEEIFTNGGFKEKIYPERGIYRTGFGDGINEPPLSDSPTGKYRKAAVATDHHICSAVGTDILEKDGGSSVDAAIATSLCLGVVNPQSTGIGGGPIVTLYDSKEKQAFSLTCRAETPAAAYPVLFQNYVNQEKRCRISVPSNGSDAGINIGVPGEIACYKELHDRYGRLPWKHLFGPTIKLCKDGFPIEWSLATSIQDKGAEILNLPGLRNLYTDPSTGELKKEGDLLQMPKYAETLELIAEQGPDVFYQGELADTMVEEIQAAGGVLTADDLKRYKVEMKPALHTILRNGGHTVFGAHPPSGSLSIMHILKILDGYGFTEEDLKTTDRAVLMLHRTIEASRFTFPKTKRLFDDRFESNEELVQDLLSDEYADQIRSKISDEGIRSQEFYGKTLPGVEPQGTTHLSVLGDDGIAVAISATITQVFGSKILGEKTGILYNSALVDFSLPGAKAKNGEPCEPASALSPGKRPVTQMCPTIIVDSDGVISHVIGGSGGAKLTPAVIILSSGTFGSDKLYKKPLSTQE